MWELIVVICAIPQTDLDFQARAKCEERAVFRGTESSEPCTHYLVHRFRIGSAAYAYCRSQRVEK